MLGSRTGLGDLPLRVFAHCLSRGYTGYNRTLVSGIPSVAGVEKGELGMENVDPRKGLLVVVDELERLDERRAELVAERDMLILSARMAGTPWAELEEISGLSRGSVKKALDRARANE